MVAFDVGGNADVVSNGRTGVLVPFLDIETLIQSACRLLDRDYCANLRSEAASYAADKFSSDLTVEKFVSLM
jgi:glycosyltransferase involved in cell wall biosynthesis